MQRCAVYSDGRLLRTWIRRSFLRDRCSPFQSCGCTGQVYFREALQWDPQQAESHQQKDSDLRVWVLCFFFVCLVWGPLLSSAVVIYTNNNAARGVLISCGTTNASVLVATLALECDYQLTPCHAKSWERLALKRPMWMYISVGTAAATCFKVGWRTGCSTIPVWQNMTPAFSVQLALHGIVYSCHQMLCNDSLFACRRSQSR